MSTLAEAFWNVLTNPTIAYLLLIVGVWSVVLAASVPGTGLPEGAAVVCLALAAVGLIRLQASLAGLGLIGLALILFLLEFRLFAHGAFLAGGTVALVAGSLLLFRVEGSAENALSWGTVLAVSVIQDPDHVVGARGEARTDILSGGTVYAGGEEWSAYADEKIVRGSPVLVLARDGLKLKVALAGRPTPPR
jgi:membrane-bound serine protease (ClpP class)